MGSHERPGFCPKFLIINIYGYSFKEIIYSL
jgi:hypothetical protein